MLSSMAGGALSADGTVITASHACRAGAEVLKAGERVGVAEVRWGAYSLLGLLRQSESHLNSHLVQLVVLLQLPACQA
jgi:hypothetical protein